LSKRILLLGSFDTKGKEYRFVKDLMEEQGYKTLTLNTGVIGEPKYITADVTSEEVARAGGDSLASLREKKDRGYSMKVMSRGAAKLVSELYETEQFDGIFGMGGTGGTSVISAAMQRLPVGVPKVLVSTAASGNTAPYVGTRDITMVPSIVDVAGLNRVSKIVFSRAVGAICGMLDVELPASEDDRPLITASMFGNTTECVDRCREMLVDKGYEVLVFHCTGTGGKTMEDLVEDGLVTAVLDITTTEWADELCGGVFSAGATRLEAAGNMGIPHLIVPGCVDMVNFGAPDTIPERYKGRLFYEWNPSVTLMRTNIEENAEMGRIFAEKANKADGPVAFLLPLRGVSILDSEDNIFWWPEANRAMFDAIKANLKEGIPVYEVDANINDPVFSDRAVEILIELIKNVE
jgi:uncharacterized protein (UPF0261 family)